MTRIERAVELLRTMDRVEDDRYAVAGNIRPRTGAEMAECAEFDALMATLSERSRQRVYKIARG